MKILVTGVAGFIGSHIAERLLADGADVTGIDCFTDNYPREIKERNLSALTGNSRFGFIEADLLKTDLAASLNGVEAVFHEAAIPGVRDSWGRRFELYLNNNILATQKLLEAAKNLKLKKFVLASSSSIYGDAESFPTREDALPRPMSPYGVTKLSSEHLALLYEKNFGVPAVALRYFTVYGPRQRPDMAFNILLRAARDSKRFDMFGDGSQTRDFTYISDAVAANLSALERGAPGRSYNIGGGSRVSMNHVIETVKKITGAEISIALSEAKKGDVRNTSADTSLARAELGYSPSVSLEDGLRSEWEWIKKQS
ncbi:MAG: NAD-dependent epimerase/dehydratase family protein [bacterium]